MKVKCPRCGRLLTAHQGEPDAMCYCHLYCEDGDKPADCTLIDHQSAPNDAWAGRMNWPQGMHLGRGKTQDNTQTRVKWCTTHERFVDKVPFLIPLDWTRFHSKRASKKLRMTRDV